MPSPAVRAGRRPISGLQVHLSELRLSAAAESLTAVVDGACDQRLSPITLLFGIEVAAVYATRHAGLLRFASLPVPCRMEDFDFAIGLARAAIGAGHPGLLHHRCHLAKRCKRAALEGRWATAMRCFSGPPLLVTEKLAYARHNPGPEANTALFELISSPDHKSSTIVSSYAGIASWG